MENKFFKTTQIGIVTDKSKEEIIETMRRLFGMEPSSMNGTKEDDDRRYRGEFSPFKVENVNYKFAAFELQFSIPVGDAPSAWKDWLAAHGTSVHRIAFATDCWADAEAQMTAAGVELIQKGNGLHGIPGGYFGYFDTGDLLGFQVGLVNKQEVAWKQAADKAGYDIIKREK